jgi:hypothetical protein
LFGSYAVLICGAGDPVAFPYPVYFAMPRNGVAGIAVTKNLRALRSGKVWLSAYLDDCEFAKLRVVKNL